MSTVILKNLYRGGNNIKQMFRDGEKIYQMFERFIFEVDADSLTFDYTGNTLTLTITASDPWTMTKPEWITASSISGIGNTTVTLTVPQNPTEDSRDGNIVLTCEGRTITVPIEQNGSFGLGTPLTFEITGNGYINWYAYNASYTRTIEYKLNDNEWTSITSTNSGVHINVVSGDVVQFRGDNASYSPGAQNRFSCFSACTCQFIVKGNIMSLINSTDFKDLKTLTDTYTFRSFFNSCTGLTSAENLFLPATTLALGCYRSMFDTCRSLTIAPVLPATTLTGECYNNMFLRCSSLNYVKCLATTNINTNKSTNSWMYNVNSSGVRTFVKKTGVSWPSGGNGIPSGWTVIEADE